MTDNKKEEKEIVAILDKVNSPEDLKALNFEELAPLAQEIRELLLYKVSEVGGHVGPNLGVVELTMALHRVFESPKDKFVWDVSHQTYPHKILTGRKIGFRKGHFHDISPYSSQDESVHDFFKIGHTSTSIANALGLAQARDLTGGEGAVVAIIGDGSLSGGLAFEALNNAGAYQGNLIIVVNDNDMSIAENHGGIYDNLRALRDSHGFAQDNLFKAFGLDYYYVAEGNDLAKLIEVFEQFKKVDHPIVIHLRTEKGLGYSPALAHKEAWHFKGPFDLKTGEVTNKTTSARTYVDAIHELMDEKIAQEMPIMAINAGIPGTFRLKDFAKKHPERYYDAGIAEQFTITFGGAMALAGARPIIFHNSTFLQRAYDQMVHDLAANSEPALILLKGGVISNSAITHQGTLAMTWLSNIPNLIYLAPTSEEELVAMMNWALSQREHPVIIQLPEHELEHRPSAFSIFLEPHYQITRYGKDVAILGLGGMFSQAEKVAQQLDRLGLTSTLVNPLHIGQLDKSTLKSLAKTHRVLVTFEDGILEGGFGQKVASFLGSEDIRVLNFGAHKEFNEEVPVAELYARYHLLPELAVKDILQVFQ